MEKEVGTANEILRAESSGGFNNFKETIYNIIGNSFNCADSNLMHFSINNLAYSKSQENCQTA
jgi:hypothetical protein